MITLKNEVKIEIIEEIYDVDESYLNKLNAIAE